MTDESPIGPAAEGDVLREQARSTLHHVLRIAQVALVLALVGYGLSGIRAIRPNEVGIKLSCGRVVRADLKPGIHMALPWPVGLEIVLGVVLLAYIPMTHMSHFFTKWFMYHDVRWNDEPNLAGSKIEQRVAEALKYPVSWSASHIRGDGKKNWGDVATSDVEENRQ